MEYRSVADLNNRIADWVHTLPRDIEIIAGVPRSGLLAANLLALHVNLPVTDIEGLTRGTVMHVGSRYAGAPTNHLLRKRATVLVVEDSCASGSSLAHVREQLKTARLPHRILYGAVFVSPDAVKEGYVDHYAEIVPSPRVFEWNIMHTPLMSKFCVDIDGVLCRDPDPAVNDDGVRYRRWLDGVQPFILPRYEIGWLVTSRLEKYRTATEEWLHRHGIRFRELIMMQHPDMRARQRAADYSHFKANAYLRTGASLFIESAPHTASEVAELSGKPVFCVDTRQMVYPGDFPRPQVLPVRRRHPIEQGFVWTARLPGRVLRKVTRTLGGEDGRTRDSSGAETPTRSSGRSPSENNLSTGVGISQPDHG